VSAPPIFFPRTLAEAAEILSEYDGQAKVVAGSTALSLLMGQKLVNPEALVSISRIPELNEITVADGVLTIGALVTHFEVDRSPVVREHAPIIAQAFAVVGNPRIRSAATVGGVMAEADYASDPPAAVVLLDGWVTAVSPNGSRRVPASDLFVGFYETSLESDEVISHLHVPTTDSDTFTSYLKYSSRSAEDRPCVGVAVLVRMEADRTCADVRVSVGAAAEVPVRLRDVEGEMVGGSLKDAAIRRIADAYADALDPIEDVRGTGWYRTEMTRNLITRALANARESSPGDPRAGEQHDR
jgi:carbon-monoxide dehydrogenase medium subunit